MKLDNENDTGRINENMRRFMFTYLVQGLERIFKARSKRKGSRIFIPYNERGLFDIEKLKLQTYKVTQTDFKIKWQVCTNQNI